MTVATGGTRLIGEETEWGAWGHLRGRRAGGMILIVTLEVVLGTGETPQVIFPQESLLASNVDRMVTGQGSVRIRTREQALVPAVQTAATEGMEDTVAMEDTVEDPTSLEDPSLRTCVTSVAREATGPGSARTHRETPGLAVAVVVVVVDRAMEDAKTATTPRGMMWIHQELRRMCHL